MNISNLVILILTLLSCWHTNSHRENSHQTVQQLKDTCDNPDADINCSFVGVPAAVSNTMNIAVGNEFGDKLIISGTLYKADGKSPYPNITIYAYHTDSKGYYSKKGTETGVQKWHGHLHGWCKTDSKGQYKIHTIRPARYPDNSMPAHIHAAIKKDNGQMYWINDFVFKDDNLVNEKYLSSLFNVGGTGIVDINKDAENTWIGIRDIVLTK